MRVFAGTAAALAVMGSAGAHAQVYVTEPAPAYVGPAPYYAPAPVAPPVVTAPPLTVAPPVAVAPAYVAPDYAYAYAPTPYAGATVVNPRTGRSCTINADGYRWCWTP
jgi:hypothetical protein